MIYNFYFLFLGKEALSPNCMVSNSLNNQMRFMSSEGQTYASYLRELIHNKSHIHHILENLYDSANRRGDIREKTDVFIMHIPYQETPPPQKKSHCCFPDCTIRELSLIIGAIYWKGNIDWIWRNISFLME